MASGGDLKAGIIGVITAAAFGQIGHGIFGQKLGTATSSHGFLDGIHLKKIIAHGVVGGASAELQGGKFYQGFLSAGTTQAFSPLIGEFKFEPIRVAIAGGIGGTASVLGGGKFVNGSVTSSFAYLFNSGGVRQQGGAGGDLVGGVLDVAGKIWALPNTIIGLAYGGAGHILGWMMGTNPSYSFENNAIQFENNPLMATAMTFGNVIVYGTDPVWFQPDSQRGQYTLGYEEMQHTYQAQVLGPLYFPAHAVSGAIGLLMNGDWHGSSAFLEVGPHARNPRPWP